MGTAVTVGGAIPAGTNLTRRWGTPRAGVGRAGAEAGLLHIALPTTLSAASVATVDAQRNGSEHYPFGRDTLRYAEQTVSRITMQVPGGEVVVKSSHDAGIGIRGVGEGRAEGWYDRIVLRQEAPSPGMQEPATDALIGTPFALAVSATGHVQTQTVPPIPAAVSSTLAGTVAYSRVSSRSRAILSQPLSRNVSSTRVHEYTSTLSLQSSSRYGVSAHVLRYDV